MPELTGLTTWAGKIVVDTTNQFAAAHPWRGRYDVGDLTGSESVAQHLPGARVMKALNTLYARFIAADPRPTLGPLELPSGTVPPTRKRMDAPCCDVFELVDGKIKRFDCYAEGSVIAARLGPA